MRSSSPPASAADLLEQNQKRNPRAFRRVSNLSCKLDEPI